MSPRLEGYLPALQLSGHDESEWPWLVDGARLLHRILYRTEFIDWYQEIGKSMRDVTPEDVASG